MSQHTRPLNRQDYKTLTLAALGGALEFYDFIIFVFFAAVVGELFFPADIPEWLRQVQTFGIFAAGYLARPLGGIIMAHFGDLVGRKKMFTLSILLMALPTLAIGLLPTYASIGIAAPLLLLLMRILQGAAIGGKCPAPGFLSPNTCRKSALVSPAAPHCRPDGWHSAGIGGRDAD
jgi:MFS family permease